MPSHWAVDPGRFSSLLSVSDVSPGSSLHLKGTARCLQQTGARSRAWSVCGGCVHARADNVAVQTIMV